MRNSILYSIQSTQALAQVWAVWSIQPETNRRMAMHCHSAKLTPSVVSDVRILSNSRMKIGKTGKTGKTGKPGKTGKTCKPGKTGKTGKPGKTGKTGESLLRNEESECYFYYMFYIATKLKYNMKVVIYLL